MRRTGRDARLEMKACGLTARLLEWLSTLLGLFEHWLEDFRRFFEFSGRISA